MEKDLFAAYIRASDGNKREKSYAWATAIGLQQVDRLEPSQYLLDTAVQHIEGKITIDEAGALIDNYYQENAVKTNRTEEADKVSQRIAKLLSEPAFSFTPIEYIAIHRKLFEGLYSHAGQIRDYNITKKEWVLNGETVIYGTASELRATLEYDLSEEKKYAYAGHSMDEIIQHLAYFVSRLWQIHIFGEGNTRTTAVFFIKYLRTLGFHAENGLFAENAWYFRNALVRANYTNVQLGIHETTAYLELFLRNLLLNENHPLKNRTMHISGMMTDDLQPDVALGKKEEYPFKADIEIKDSGSNAEKPDIGTTKSDIGQLKADIALKIKGTTSRISDKTIVEIMALMDQIAPEEIFGRGRVTEVTGLKSSRASDLIKLMLDSGLIRKAVGFGKGKYFFNDLK